MFAMYRERMLHAHLRCFLTIITICINNPDELNATCQSVYSQTTDSSAQINERVEHIIVDGAMFYAYQFRADTQAAQISQAKFETGIKYMRSLYINHYDYVRSTVISHPRSSLRAL